MSTKFALIIANTDYADPGLAKLSAPGRDAEDFARVLRDPEISAFDEVNILLNQPEYVVREAIDDFFNEKKPDDLLVLYFSGHGVRDELGSLYLAVKNTIRSKLRATGIKSDYIREAMDQSRSRRQVLILDCCNSGAFAQGTKAATGVSIGTASAFEGGYGRVILTASDATQYAWEGETVTGEAGASLFTRFLVEGLEGEADLDGDGRITVDELYDYAYEKVKLATPKQSPSKFSTKQQGEIVLRQFRRMEDIKAVALPEQLLNEIENPYPEVRLRAVEQLGKILNGKNLGLVRSAREALEKIAAEDDSRRVSGAATQVLESFLQVQKQAEEERKAKEEAERLAFLKAEEERLAREKAEADRRAREEAERLARAQAAREAAEREAMRLKAEREAAEKAAREAAEKAAREKAERELAEREAARLAAERETARKAAEREAALTAERDAAKLALDRKAAREAAEQAEREAVELAARRKAEREAKVGATAAEKQGAAKSRFLPIGIVGAIVVIAAIAVIVVVSLLRSPTSPASPPSPQPTAAVSSPQAQPGIPVKALKIVSSLPMTGSSLTQTQTIVNAEQLRLAQANNEACGGRYALTYESWDDASPATGQWDAGFEAENGNKAAAGSAIIAYLGTFNSGAAKLSIPILNRAGLVMISPANTYPGLTKPGKGQPDEPDKYYPTGVRNYARVVTTDEVQGSADASYMFNQLGVRTVYILDDQELYGKGVADLFEASARQLGMTVLGHARIDTSAPNYKLLMHMISTSNNGQPPDGIFVGTYFFGNNAGQFLKDKVTIVGDNTQVKLMGPDGLQTQAIIDAAGANIAEGIYASIAGLPFPDGLTDAGKKFVADYEAKYGKLTEPYSIYGYEAMNVLLKAIEDVCAQGGDPSVRKQVRDAVFAIRGFNGVLGTWSFDQNGDTTLSEMTVYQVRNGSFVTIGTFR